jgi:hypothetical protein
MHLWLVVASVVNQIPQRYFRFAKNAEKFLNLPMQNLHAMLSHGRVQTDLV